MKVNSIHVEFIEKEATPTSLEPLTGEVLYQVQHMFRERIYDILNRAMLRRQDYFEMAALDSRYPHFPVEGGAKIMAQEILKVSKQKNNPIEHIDLFVSNSNDYKKYIKVFKSYVKHVIEQLGKEPFKTTDIIIEVENGVVLIERSNPPYGWALPGGFIDSGEDVKEAAIREAKEETHLALDDVKKLGVYKDKYRDPRFHTSTTVFTAKGVGKPRFGDDARGLQVIPREELLLREYAFDHKTILQDYLKKK